MIGYICLFLALLLVWYLSYLFMNSFIIGLVLVRFVHHWLCYWFNVCYIGLVLVFLLVYYWSYLFIICFFIDLLFVIFVYYLFYYWFPVGYMCLLLAFLFVYYSWFWFSIVFYHWLIGRYICLVFFLSCVFLFAMLVYYLFLV